jgi:hypothetical protein
MLRGRREAEGDEEDRKEIERDKKDSLREAKRQREDHTERTNKLKSWRERERVCVYFLNCQFKIKREAKE